MLCRPLELPSSGSRRRGWNCTVMYHPRGITSPLVYSRSWWMTRFLRRTRSSGRPSDSATTAPRDCWGCGWINLRGGSRRHGRPKKTRKRLRRRRRQRRPRRQGQIFQHRKRRRSRTTGRGYWTSSSWRFRRGSLQRKQLGRRW